MKNKYVSTRIMAMVMAAAMTVSAAPAVMPQREQTPRPSRKTTSRQQKTVQSLQTPKILPQRQPRQNIL